MNWKEINDTCPNAFLEWVSSKVGYDVTTVTYCEEKEIYQKDNEHCFELPNVDFLWVGSGDMVCFPCYFDQYGIQIGVSPIPWNSNFNAKVSIPNPQKDGRHKKEFYCGFFPDRLAATAAGVKKAFEIRERQLIQDAKLKHLKGDWLR